MKAETQTDRVGRLAQLLLSQKHFAGLDLIEPEALAIARFLDEHLDNLADEEQCYAGIITVLLSDIKSLPENERLAIRNYVVGGGKLNGAWQASCTLNDAWHVRYKNHPEVRRILAAFHIKEIAPKANKSSAKDGTHEA